MRYFICTLALLFALPACTLVTDFSDPGDDLYPLRTNLTSDVSVTLSGDTASLTLSFIEPLPGTTEDDPALLELITNGTIGLVVENVETGVTFSIANDGTYAEELTGPGEYNLSMGSDRTQILVNLYNEVLDGSALHAGVDYSARITVLDNDWFETDEGFDRDVTVQ